MTDPREIPVIQLPAALDADQQARVAALVQAKELLAAPERCLPRPAGPVRRADRRWRPSS